MMWSRPCACGYPVVANPNDPTEGVRDHNETRRHREWSDAVSWFPRRLFPDPTSPLPAVDVSDRPEPRPVRERRRVRRWAKVGVR